MLCPLHAPLAPTRLPLSQESCCLSFGTFLQLCFSASQLQVLGRPLHTQFVRYFGLGRTVMCLHEDCVYPSAIRMPPVPMCFSYNAQLMWLKQEAAELTQVRAIAGHLHDISVVWVG